MFLTLLLVTFAVSLGTAALLAGLFRDPVDKILARIIADDISSAWRRYITFAIYVTGVSGGVRIWDLEQYITPRVAPSARMLEGVEKVADVVALTTDRWVLEVYRTLIGTLQSVAWMLLVFFVFSLVAYVIVRVSERRSAN
ncbi:MAG: hypothetical protein HOM68_10515 [Gemmatimonadetes bacterium]|jgi:hypothetical protein|nr:hypothetical protein [Gemmatimonadota bacterium]MBT4609056.1 hypothetical protein [Gemmatimonadota bacterium]MBT5056961.1 hypothetical protein [Gemmatimonadota bacterium]MBT5142214.1 hypothetical protein [Gemmatimonadota bacterium]MBT5589201.1 hypothetical protein [Gemmatimonadota bacterium]